ncbi:SIR2 family protein [Arthrobacter zhaoguopingii]|uniref:SIR2 family protein n=1 Tax=Arthrobacter zhaoguopingii TaxID=2681491 RepID=UPI00135B5300|nr:SIR2 family protein [Arthrobacter zhaoguopingii]
MLDECERLADAEEVDIALVLQDQRDFALAQQIRIRSGRSLWNELNPNLQEHAQRLAGLALKGQLVPFMGAGVSISAGAPTWAGLIDRLASAAGLNQNELAELTKRHVLDQASILRAVFSQSGRSLNETIAKEVRLERYGLAPAILASLPSKQAITLNYDELFEQASEDAGISLAVIPGDFSAGTDRWLLKLHGTVSEPESIVLTREDYLGYSSTRSALSALVKANLITHHLLFVGFGLTDDHFHEIVHDVRRALPELSSKSHDVATAITLFEDPLDEYAWKDKLALLPLTQGRDVAQAARLLEIFLDMVLAYATDSHSYLLADNYREALTDTEASIRQKLLALSGDLTPEERASSEGVRVVALLDALGASKSPGAPGIIE